MPGDTDEVLVYKGADIADAMNGTFIIMEVSKLEGTTLAEGLKQLQESMGAKPGKDITIAGQTYKSFTATEDGVESTILVAEKNGCSIMAAITKAKVDDPDVQAIVGSIRVK